VDKNLDDNKRLLKFLNTFHLIGYGQSIPKGYDD